MKDFTIEPDTKITLYLKECYGCDRNGKYDPLRRFILDHKVKLTNLVIKRVELDLDWQKEALLLEMELPALLFNNGDQKYAITYSEFLRKIKQDKTQRKTKSKESAEPRNAAEGAVSDRVTDGTPPFFDKVEEVKNGRSKTNKSIKAKSKAKPKKDRKD